MELGQLAAPASPPNSEDDLRWVVLGIDYLFQAYDKDATAKPALNALSVRVSERSGGMKAISFWDLT